MLYQNLAHEPSYAGWVGGVVVSPSSHASGWRSDKVSAGWHLCLFTSLEKNVYLLISGVDRCVATWFVKTEKEMMAQPTKAEWVTDLVGVE